MVTSFVNELVTFDLPIMNKIHAQDFVPKLLQTLLPGKQQSLSKRDAVISSVFRKCERSIF